MSQPTLIRRILKVVNVTEERSKGRSLKRTPATKVLKRDADGPERILKWEYRSVLGMLNWLTRSTRPDIGFAVSQAARFMAFPKRTHEAAVIRICEYLRDTKDEGLFLQPDNSGFKVWADADFSGGFDRSNPDDSSTAKSRSIVLIRFFKEIAKRIKAFRNTKPKFCCKAFEDNNGALALAGASTMKPRTKHINLKYHHFKTAVKKRMIMLEKVATEEQIADIGTKPLEPKVFEYLRKKLVGW